MSIIDDNDSQELRRGEGQTTGGSQPSIGDLDAAMAALIKSCRQVVAGSRARAGQIRTGGGAGQLSVHHG